MVDVFSVWNWITQNANVIVHGLETGAVSAANQALKAARTVTGWLGQAQPFLNIGSGAYVLVGSGISGSLWIYRVRAEQNWQKLKEGLKPKKLALNLVDGAVRGAQAGVSIALGVSAFSGEIPSLNVIQDTVEGARHLINGSQTASSLTEKKLSKTTLFFGMLGLVAAALGSILLYDRYLGGNVLPPQLSSLLSVVVAAGALRSVYKAARDYRHMPSEAAVWIKEGTREIWEGAKGVASAVRHPQQTRKNLRLLAFLN